MLSSASYALPHRINTGRTTHRCSRRVPANAGAAVLDLSTTAQRGEQWRSVEFGVAARVAVIWRRHLMPLSALSDERNGIAVHGR